MPILAATGVVATLTPLICLTSCSWKPIITHDCFATYNVKKDRKGYVTITATLKPDYSKIDRGSSKVYIQTNKVSSNVTFNDLIEENHMKLTETDKNVTIHLFDTFIEKYEQYKIESVEFKIYGIKG